MINSTTPHIVIGLITYQRPAMLRSAMESLYELALPEGCDIEFVLVDNDAAGSARPVFDALSAALPFRAYYDIEPEKGIPFARNRVLRHAQDQGADYLCFFDDDDTVDPWWLCYLLNTMRHYQCAAVCGHKRVANSKDLPGWAQSFFIIESKETGCKMKMAPTSNVIFDPAFLSRHGLAFDKRFAQTGGSDLFLSEQIRQAGGEIRMASEAVVYEYYPPSRMTVRWLLRRGYRSGNNRARINIYHNGQLAFLGNLPLTLAKHVKKSIEMVLLWIVHRRASYGIHALHCFARMSGHIAAAFGQYYNEYDQIHGH